MLKTEDGVAICEKLIFDSVNLAWIYFLKLKN